MPPSVDCKFFNRCPASLFEDTFQIDIPAIADNQTIPWNDSHHVVKLSFDSCKIRKYICVIKLKIVQDGCFGVIVHKF